MQESKLLTDALAAAIRAEAVNWSGLCNPEDWQALYALSCDHRVQALVLEAVYGCPDFALAEPRLKNTWRREAMAVAAGQAMRDARFREIYRTLASAGIRPIVMKGAVCRSLYPKAELRPSSDEDLLVPPAQFQAALACLRSQGARLADPNTDLENSFEVGLLTPDGLLLELHSSPFAPQSGVLEPCNTFFCDVHSRAADVDGVSAMCAHDHMLYLLLHAFKHFIHSGFGLRQVCDMALWAEKHGEQIHWPLLWQQCSQVRCLKFAQTVFAAAREHLGFRPGFSLPDGLPVREFMEDLLGAGVFGSSSGSRVHSATVTLNAVEADRRGEKASLLQSLFPVRKSMERNYPYVRRSALLLPVAWCSRLVRYAGETLRTDKNSGAESLQIGNRRKKLLQQLDIID